MDLRTARADALKAQSELQAAQAHLAGMLQIPERGLAKINTDIDLIPLKAPRDGTCAGCGWGFRSRSPPHPHRRAPRR
jgi:hypothetical protein